MDEHTEPEHTEQAKEEAPAAEASGAPEQQLPPPAPGHDADTKESAQDRDATQQSAWDRLRSFFGLK